MLPQPQHPIHYAFGVVSHYPSVLEAWLHERVSIKILYHLLYIYLFFGVGAVTGGLKSGFDMVGLLILTTFLTSIPCQLFSYRKWNLMAFSDSYFNAVIAFHGFFITYFVVYNIVVVAANLAGVWTEGVIRALMALSAALMVGYSVQLAVSANPKLRWYGVPLISIGLGYGLFRALGRMSGA